MRAFRKTVTTDRRATHRRRAFSLVEIMVVVGIIALLATILIPAISSARRSAKVASTQATLTVLEQGIATFRADQVVGGSLPPSRPDSNGSSGLPDVYHVTSHTSFAQKQLAGANLLAWALVGADLQGSAGFRDLDGDGFWSDDARMHYLADVNNQPFTSRSGPFVEPESVDMPSYIRAAPNVQNPDTFYIDDQPALTEAGKVTSVMFLDAWSQPILYYKASPAQPRMAGEGRFLSNPSIGIYEVADNAMYTGLRGGSNNVAGGDLGAGTEHPMGNFEDLDPREVPSTRQSFEGTIYNPNTPGVVKPYRADSYILITPGPDALYGTADDIANFDVNR